MRCFKCLIFLLIFPAVSPLRAQFEFNFGANTGLWHSNALGNLQIHAFKQNRAGNYQDPIHINNYFYGANIEFRLRMERFAFTMGWTNHRNVYSGGGPSATGYAQHFSYKVRLNYVQLMGFEYVHTDKLAIGVSLDLGRWRVLYKSDTETEKMEDYKPLYGEDKGFLTMYGAPGFTEWIRLGIGHKERINILFSHHGGIGFSNAIVPPGISYNYRFSNFNLSLRYVLGKKED